jgi:hypothetical protein
MKTSKATAINVLIDLSLIPAGLVGISVRDSGP